MNLTELIDKNFSTIVSSVVLAGATVFGAIMAYRAAVSQRGTYAKQIHAIDFAIKRNEYWTEYLKTSELVYGSDSDLHTRTKAEVIAALERIRKEADAEMKRLSWPKQIRRSLRKQEHTLDKPIKRSFAWGLSMVGFVFLAVLAVLLIGLFMFGVLRGKANSGNTWPMFLLVATAVGSAVMSVNSFRQAREERYPEPLGPLVDRI